MKMEEYTVPAPLRARYLDHFVGNWKKWPMVARYKYNPIVDGQRLFIEVSIALIGERSRAGTRHQREMCS
jgi:hypothetical protein